MVSSITWWIVWIPRFTGTLSAFSSSMIIYYIITTFQSCRKKPNCRLLLALSVIDVIQSIAFTTSSAPMPKGDYFGAIGNDTSCSIQGFFIHLGFAVPCYNASLCLFFFLTVCRNYDPEVFIKKIEPFCHIFALGYPTVSAIICASLGLFNGNGSGNFCWLYDVDKPFRSYMVSSLAGGVPTSVSLIVIVYTMISINKFVLKRHRASRRHSFTGHETPAMEAIKQNARTQAILFSSAFFLTYIWCTVSIIMNVMGVADRANDLVLLAQSIFLPLQGFWNFIIFARPMVQKLRRRLPDLTLLGSLMIIICDPQQTLVQQSRRGSINARNANTLRRLSQNNRLEEGSNSKSLPPLGPCVAAAETAAAVEIAAAGFFKDEDSSTPSPLSAAAETVASRFKDDDIKDGTLASHDSSRRKWLH